jgi:hypothetical protein
LSLTKIDSSSPPLFFYGSPEDQSQAQVELDRERDSKPFDISSQPLVKPRQSQSKDFRSLEEVNPRQVKPLQLEELNRTQIKPRKARTFRESKYVTLDELRTFPGFEFLATVEPQAEPIQAQTFQDSRPVRADQNQGTELETTMNHEPNELTPFDRVESQVRPKQDREDDFHPSQGLDPAQSSKDRMFDFQPFRVLDETKFEPRQGPAQGSDESELKSKDRQERMDDLKPFEENGVTHEQQNEPKIGEPKPDFRSTRGHQEKRVENVEPNQESTYEGHSAPKQDPSSHEGLGTTDPSVKSHHGIREKNVEPFQDRANEELGVIKSDTGFKFSDRQVEMRGESEEPKQKRVTKEVVMIKPRSNPVLKLFGGQHEMGGEYLKPKQDRTFESPIDTIEHRTDTGYKPIEEIEEEEQVEPDGELKVAIEYEVEPRHDRMDDFKPDGGLVPVNETMLRAVGLVEEEVFLFILYSTKFFT